MLDKALFALLISAMNADLVARSLTNVAVKQRYQPTRQGVESGPAIYIFKVSDHRYGYPAKIEEWDRDNEIMVHKEKQIYETVFQVSALVRQQPQDVTGFTASDLVNTAAQIVQGDTFIAALRAGGVGMERAQEIRNPYFSDDFDQFEADPSFDFTVTHEQVIIKTSPVVETYEFNMQRV